MNEFIDLLGFARGAEMANLANWRDTFNDIKARAGEETLRQSQQLYDLNMPMRVMSTEEQMSELLGNRMAADATTRLSQQLAALPEEQRAGMQANELSRLIAEADTTRPESRSFLNAIQAQGHRTLAELANAGRWQEAETLARALPGVTNASNLARVQTLRNPGYLADDMNVAAEGGAILGPDQVQYRGATMSRAQFGQMRERELLNPAEFSPFGGVQELQQRQQQLQFQNTLAERLAKAGLQAAVNPVTGQLTLIPQQQAAVGYAPAQQPAMSPQQILATLNQQPAQPAQPVAAQPVAAQPVAGSWAPAAPALQAVAPSQSAESLRALEQLILGAQQPAATQPLRRPAPPSAAVTGATPRPIQWLTGAQR